MGRDADVARRHPGGFRAQALERRSRPAGALHRRCLRARHAARARRRAAGGQRADPVFAGRQSLYRAGARPARLLSLQHLQLRHLPGRRRGQGDRRMGDRRRAGVGPVVARSAPLHRLCHADLHRRQGDRGLSERIRARVPQRGASGRTAAAHLAAVSAAGGEGRTLRRARRLGTRGVVRARCARRPPEFPPRPRLLRRRRRRGERGAHARSGCSTCRGSRNSASPARARLRGSIACCARACRASGGSRWPTRWTSAAGWSANSPSRGSRPTISICAARRPRNGTMPTCCTRRCRADGSVRIEDVGARIGTLVLAGPRARDVLAAVTRADLSSAAFPWLSAREIEIGAAKVLALRVTYVGELGWELHAPMEHMVALYEALCAGGRRARSARFRHLRRGQHAPRQMLSRLEARSGDRILAAGGGTRSLRRFRQARLRRPCRTARGATARRCTTAGAAAAGGGRRSRRPRLRRRVPRRRASRPRHLRRLEFSSFAQRGAGLCACRSGARGDAAGRSMSMARCAPPRWPRNRSTTRPMHG